MVDDLKKRGVPVEYVLFPDEGHGFRKTPNRVRSTVSIVRVVREVPEAAEQKPRIAGRSDALYHLEPAACPAHPAGRQPSSGSAAKSRKLCAASVLTAPAAGRRLAAAETALERAVGVEVARALKDTAALGVHIVELDSGETVYGYNPDEPRVIASNSKLFTTAAALDTLRRRATSSRPGFLMRGSGDGTACSHGDLGVVGARRSADLRPRLRRRRLRRLPALGARRSASAGVRAGDAATSGSPTAFSRPLRSTPTGRATSSPRWYEAPVAALSFSDNCILVRVSPGRAGRPARGRDWSRRCRSSGSTTRATTRSKRRGTPRSSTARGRPADGARLDRRRAPARSRPG